MRNDYKIEGEITKIYLPGGDICIVDTVDLDMLLKLDANWTVHQGDTTKYVRGKHRGKNIRMHRYLCGLASGDTRVVDHKDWNGLNNTRINMKVCTQAINNKNRRVPGTNKSGYRGVYLTPNAKWKAKVYVDNRKENLVVYKDALEAARVVNRKRVEYGMYVDRVSIKL